MRVIYKYPLAMEETQEIEYPAGSKLLSVGLDPHEGICIWAEVDTDAAKAKFTVWLQGTGHPMTVWDGYGDPGKRVRFLGTVRDGHYMWHVYVLQA